MPELTADQAFQLALAFKDIANKLEDYRFTNWDAMTPDQRTKLEGLEWTVRNYSSDFNALSIKLTLDDLDGTLENIKQATDQMKSAIKNLEKIDKIIKIATSAVTIGAAIVSGNPAAIASAIGSALAPEDDKDKDKAKDKNKDA